MVVTSYIFTDRLSTTTSSKPTRKFREYEKGTIYDSDCCIRNGVMHKG